MADEEKNLKENGDPKRTKLPANHVVKSKESHTIRYAFSPDDIQEKAKRMAASVQKKSSINDELKSIKSDFKSRLDQEDAIINQMGQHIANGYDNRNVECDVVKDFEKGIKTYFYNGVEYDTAPLTNSDRQTELNLMNNAPAKVDVSAAKEVIMKSPAVEEQDES